MNQLWTVNNKAYCIVFIETTELYKEKVFFISDIKAFFVYLHDSIFLVAVNWLQRLHWIDFKSLENAVKLSVFYYFQLPQLNFEMKVVLLLIASILLQETTAELVLTTCARMNDGALSKVAQGLCISSCKFQVITSFFLYRICQKNANEWHFDNYFKIVSSSQNSWSLYVHTITCETSNTSLYFSKHLLF